MEPSQTVEALREPVPREVARPRDLGNDDERPERRLPEARPGMLGQVREAAAGISLLPRLGVRALVKMTQGTKLGRTWIFIRPLMDGLGMSLLFGAVLKVGAPGNLPYYLFLMSGLLSWRLFERSLRYGAKSFSIYQKMMMTFRFPLLLVPLAALAYPLVEIAIYWLIFVGSVVFFWAHDGHLYLQAPPQLLLVIPGLMLLALMVVGMSLWISVLNAKARDTRQILRYITPIWMFSTPVIYPPSKLPESLQLLVTINPMSAPVELIKAGLLGAAQVNFQAIAWSLAIGGAILLSGLWFFDREAARSIDVLGFDEDDEM